MNQAQESLFEKIKTLRAQLTPKGKHLAEYVLQNPQEAVFLRTRELGAACGVSEATVVRFVNRLGYAGYREFILALRDLVDTEMTFIDRVKLVDVHGQETERMGRVVYDEIRNLKKLFDSLDYGAIREAAERIKDAPAVDVIGSRLSYTFAYYLGWVLTKIRPGITILKGSDSTAIDRLTLSAGPVLVIMIAITRYPNELIRLARVARRNGHRLLLITDSPLCPIRPFADVTLIGPYARFLIVGSPSTISCLINCLVFELIHRYGDELRQHQEKLETAFIENDILFNLDRG